MDITDLLNEAAEALRYYGRKDQLADRLEEAERWIELQNSKGVKWYVAQKEAAKSSPMITAEETRALFDHAGKAVDDYLKHSVEPRVVFAAKHGKREVTILIGSVDAITRIDSALSPVHRAAEGKLHELGYTASISLYGEAYVPAGLADDDGNGPKHKNVGLHIRW